MLNRFKMPVAAHLLLLRGDEVLLLLRAGTGYEDGKYSVVAGHMDGDEPGLAAMVREAKEEAGIEIEAGWLDLACVVHRKAADRESIDFFYRCDRWTGEIRNMEPDRCAELRFVSVDALPQNTLGYVRTAIDALRTNVRYIEFGWPSMG